LGDATGLLLVVFGALAMTDWETVWERDPHTGIDIPRTVYPNFDRGVSMIIAGSVILGISRVVQIAAPFIFTPRYNERLRQALNMSAPPLAITPSIDFDGMGSVSVAWGFRF